SIASFNPGSEIRLAVALVKYRTIMKSERKGLCSEWFRLMSPGTPISMTINKGSMHLPTDMDSPIILLCAGTGIAPMISIIEKISTYPIKPLVYLFFGCRKSKADALFIEQLKAKYSFLQMIFMAGSRDGPKGVAKVYLQDLLLLNAEHIIETLNHPKCHIYLSGNSKLPA